ncbi:MAG: MFS transporter [Roseivivax sp.]|nr:MFS transporter [Roseivivax sp.]
MNHLFGVGPILSTRLVFLLAGLATAAWAPLVPFAKERLGVDAAVFGLLLLCLGIGSLLAMPVTGVLAARHGCRKVILVAAAVLAAAMPFLVLASTPLALGLTLAVFGAAVGTVDVAMNVQAVAVEQQARRALMSGFHGMFSLGGILGAGGVALALGAGLGTLATIGLGAALVLALLALSAPGLLPSGSAAQGGGPLFVLPRGVVVLIGLMCFAVFLAEGAVLDWSALFLIRAQDIPAENAGLGYMMFAVAMTAGRLTGDRIVGGLGGPRVLALGGALAAAGFALTVAAPLPVLAFAGFALVGLGASNIVPVLFSAAGAQTAMPASLAIAAVTTFGYAGMLIGPAAIGLVAERASLGAAFAGLAVALLALALAGPGIVRRPSGV